MKLKSVLKSLDVESLHGIQEYWDLPAPAGRENLDQERWVEHLYPRLQNGGHFQVALEQLEPSQRDLVSFLAIHGGNMEEKELRKRFFGGNREEMREAVAAMARRGFVFHERWTDVEGKPHVYGIPEPFLRLIDLPHFWHGHLGNLLREVPVAHLHRIASEGLGLKHVSNKRDRLLYEVREQLLAPDNLRLYVDSLSETRREILLLLLQRRGVCLYSELLELAQTHHPNLGRDDPIESLLGCSGLLFRETDNASKYENLLRVPRDVYYIMTHHFVRDSRGLDDLDAMGHVEPGRQPKTILDNGISILRDAVIFVCSIEHHPLRRLGNGGIGKNDLKRILARLSANKTLKYAQFLAYYCIRKRFLVPLGDQWAVGETFREELVDSRRLFLDLYTTWLNTSEWNEEYLEGDCVHADSSPGNLINIIELRFLVLENLAKIPFDTWIDGPRFIESLLSQIEIRIPHRGAKGHLERHNRINYLAIESILCETLYWSGLVSLGLHEATEFEDLGNRYQADLSRQAGLPKRNNEGHGASETNNRLDHHFNFNPRPFLPEAYQFHFQIRGLGRSILGAGAARAAKSAPKIDSIALPFRDDMMHFTVLPNLDVVAPPDLNLQVFYDLCQFAEIRHMDVMSTLAITRDSVRGGMERGLRGEEILTFLERGCPGGLPETVRHLVNECSNHYGELLLGYASGYVLIDDPALREDLRNSKVLAPWIKDVKGDRVILLNRGADVQHLAHDLKQIGFMPSVDSENVYASGDGRLRFSLEASDLGALLAILRFVRHLESELGVDPTEEHAEPLLNLLRPANHSHRSAEEHADAMCKRFEKTFDAALKKRLNAVANKYRRQMREFLSQESTAPARPTYTDSNPAATPRDIRKMLRFALQHEMDVQMNYKRSTGEEAPDKVQPESLSGDKLFAFSEKEQSYCAYRVSRIVSARMA